MSSNKELIEELLRRAEEQLADQGVLERYRAALRQLAEQFKVVPFEDDGTAIRIADSMEDEIDDGTLDDMLRHIAGKLGMPEGEPEPPPRPAHLRIVLPEPDEEPER